MYVGKSMRGYIFLVPCTVCSRNAIVERKQGPGVICKAPLALGFLMFDLYTYLQLVHRDLYIDVDASLHWLDHSGCVLL